MENSINNLDSEKWPSSAGIQDPGLTPVQYIIEMAVRMKKAAPEPGTSAMTVIAKHVALNQLIAAAIQFLPQEENMLKGMIDHFTTSLPDYRYSPRSEDSGNEWFNNNFPNNHNRFRVEINGFPGSMTMREYREHVLFKEPIDMKNQLQNLSQPIVSFIPAHFQFTEIPKPPDEEE